MFDITIQFTTFLIYAFSGINKDDERGTQQMQSDIVYHKILSLRIELMLVYENIRFLSVVVLSVITSSKHTISISVRKSIKIS